MQPFELELVKRVSFLEGIRTEVLERLVGAAEVREFLPGQIILREGDIGRSMLILLEGQVDVVKGWGEDEMLLSQRGEGEVFGEMAFFEAQPRSATVRAIGPVRMLEMSEESVRAALAEQPELLYHTIQIVSARLRQAQQQMITDLQHKNQALRQAYQELTEAQAALIEKERLERELELARDLQQSILPADFPRVPGFACAARSRPARQVGGDFYDVIHLGGRRVGLVMADVSDKGMPAALFMALSRSLIRSETRRTVSPCQVLLDVNRLLTEMTQADMFVTVFYGVIDLDNNRLSYVRAGHDRPLLFRSSEQECSFLNARGIMLGLLEEIDLEEIHIDFLPGDLLVLYTDGITDANSPAGEFFGADRLQGMVCQARLSGPQELCDLIFAELDQFQNGATQYDDQAILVVKTEGLTGSVTT